MERWNQRKSRDKKKSDNLVETAERPTFNEPIVTEEIGQDATAQKQYEFALNLLQKGNVEGAKKNLWALIEVFPGSPWAHKAKRKLKNIQNPGDDRMATIKKKLK